jgi:hypothetical protein
MAKFKQGDAVRLIQPVISGTVVSRIIVDDDDHYLVEWTDGDGNPQVRNFPAEQLEPDV